MIALCGKTASGKNTIRDELVKMGYIPIVTYTTRPMRDGEVAGETYHYISEEEFIQKRDKGFFVETTSYNVADGSIWYYGTSAESLKNDNGVIILNPQGLAKIKNDKSFYSIAFYIMADEETIWNRLRQRGDSAGEARRRLNADETDFKDIDNYIDFAVTNVNKTPQEVAKIIDVFYRIERNKS